MKSLGKIIYPPVSLLPMSMYTLQVFRPTKVTASITTIAIRTSSSAYSTRVCPLSFFASLLFSEVKPVMNLTYFSVKNSIISITPFLVHGITPWFMVQSIIQRSAILILAYHLLFITIGSKCRCPQPDSSLRIYKFIFELPCFFRHESHGIRAVLDYGKVLPIKEYELFAFCPTMVRAPMTTTAMRTSSKPYSTRVCPCLFFKTSLQKRIGLGNRVMGNPLCRI